jgi:hypothetical protein
MIEQEDDDLQLLAKRVRDILGDEAYYDALPRAFAAAAVRGQPVDPLSLPGKVLPQKAFEHTSEYSMAELNQALRAELQRLLQPQ